MAESEKAAKGNDEKASGDSARLEKALKLREEMNSHRPRFVRPESWRYDRLPPMWRKPKGLDNKVRTSVKGWPPLVKVGYRGPKAARYLNSKGNHEVLVFNAKELEGLLPGRDVVRMGGTVGGRKRREILNRANELGLRIVNPRGMRGIESQK